MTGSKKSSSPKSPKSKTPTSKLVSLSQRGRRLNPFGWSSTAQKAKAAKRSRSRSSKTVETPTPATVEVDPFDLRWRPQPGPQTAAIEGKWITELFFGGARGGGKSDFLLGDYLQDAYEYGEAWRGILFRKTYPQLEDLIVRSKEIYPKAFPGAVYHEGSKTWTFPGGAFLRLRSLERDAQADNYIGHQYTWEGWDELPTWTTPTPYLKLLACLRSPVPCPVKRVRSTGNPGGVGHVWVKDRFVGLHNKHAWTPRWDPKAEYWRSFIPSKVEDNKIMLAADPGYVTRLRALAGVSDALVKAWLEGDWDVIAGAYFDSFGPHCVLAADSIRPGSYWPWWIGGDWGFKHNTALYWFTTDDAGRTLVCDELITSGKSAEELAEMVAGKNQRLGIEYGFGRDPRVDDLWFSPDAFAQRTDAETVGDQFGKALEAYGLPYAAKASTDRIGGAQLLYQMWKHKAGPEPAPGQPDTRLPDPRLLISDRCEEFINVIPAMIHDPDKQEQVLKMDGDDPYDGVRYGAYSKLGPRRKPIEDLRAQMITSEDPTVRHIQNRLAQQKLKGQGSLQAIPYNRRF